MSVSPLGIVQDQFEAVVAADNRSQPDIRNHLHDIQGNILAGFNKDFQSFLFLEFTRPEQAKQWIAGIANEIASCDEVLDFNRLFKKLKNRRGGEPGILKATWTNIAFSFSGLTALGVSGDLSSFPQAFRDGMAARAATIGDVGANAPANWISNFSAQNIHAVLIVASDTQSDMREQVSRYIQNMTALGGVDLVFLQEGEVRQDQPGHEHFGFKDGVSQPGIRGITPTTGSDPNQGDPGQDLLYPGEFVLGYPTQIAAEMPGHDGPNPDPGPISRSGPDWTRNGSYMVFRRLRQDVQGFHEFVNAQADALGLAPDIMGAKLVGRYASGCPLERVDGAPTTVDPNAGDPSVSDPSLLTDAKINDFEYASDIPAMDDTDGHLVARGAHIRKAYPRNSQFPGESETQTHRLLRRGIPFGTSFRPTLGAASSGPRDASALEDRGLLFVCYQSDLERQFEFVQSAWVNNAEFPCSIAGAGMSCPVGQPDGQDPIIAQSVDPRTFRLPLPDGSVANLAMQQWVTTTGGEYFFQPSLGALNEIAGPRTNS